MENKIKSAIVTYQQKLERKQRAIKPYREMMSNGEQLNEKQYAEFKKIEAEISMLLHFIDELNYIAE